MSQRRPSSSFARQVLLALAVACALASSATADPMPTRDYPPTYSSRKKAWYDPFGLLTSSDPAPTYQSKPIPNDVVEPGSGGPAWKWYGYGTPTPGRNPLAPNGTYPAVPASWHQTSGTTPGAIPTGPAAKGLVPDPLPLPLPRPMPGPASSIAVAPPDSPIAPAIPTESTNWKPATIRMPSANPDAPPATLKAPVAVDAVPTSNRSPTPATPLQQELGPSKSPDIPVEPAPGIVPPPSGGTSMFADQPVARGLAPIDVSESIRQACGADVRVMEVSPLGPKRLMVRLAGTLDAARAARERMAQLPELREYRVDFDLVTPLR
jgi:hypothetical protein